jgi:hypothetical protein
MYVDSFRRFGIINVNLIIGGEKMKKLTAVLTGAMLTLIFSVNAFAGAPDILGSAEEGIINTGGDFMTFVIIAAVVAVLALVIGAVTMFGGKKKKK